MSSIIKKVLIIIVILEFIAGIQGNGLIVLNLSLFDFIFACLAISRIGMIFLLLLDSIRVVLYQEILESQHIIAVIFDFFCNLSNSLSTWCATCLVIFYFLKLSNFSHPFFLWLRWRRDRVVLTILLGFFLSLFFNLLSINFDTFEVSDHLETERNLTWKKHTHKNQLDSVTTFIIIENVAFLYPSIHPFILILGNQKLRQTSASLLRQIESCLKGM
ncbi:taste receptor type 2 member 7-like [Phacochoerus africanus]|uniref:taste receptor type 2 member 7-like n=1 Tax=Phacochoerus africanus TaxID=41426 RepID=UPI001FD9734A|nr:taste receptor type 2 member 7-like [Phacochoerus africanus]